MKLNLRQSANAKRGKPEPMFQVPELRLHNGATPVKLTEPL